MIAYVAASQSADWPVSLSGHEQTTEATHCWTGKQKQVMQNLAQKQRSIFACALVKQVTYCNAVYREILQEIQRLRQQHDEASQPLVDKSQQNPTLLAELRLLRYEQSFWSYIAHNAV